MIKIIFIVSLLFIVLLAFALFIFCSFKAWRVKESTKEFPSLAVEIFTSPSLWFSPIRRVTNVANDEGMVKKEIDMQKLAEKNPDLVAQATSNLSKKGVGNLTIDDYDELARALREQFHLNVKDGAFLTSKEREERKNMIDELNRAQYLFRENGRLKIMLPMEALVFLQKSAAPLVNEKGQIVISSKEEQVQGITDDEVSAYIQQNNLSHIIDKIGKSDGYNLIRYGMVHKKLNLDAIASAMCQQEQTRASDSFFDDAPITAEYERVNLEDSDLYDNQDISDMYDNSSTFEAVTGGNEWGDDSESFVREDDDDAMNIIISDATFADVGNDEWQTELDSSEIPGFGSSEIIASSDKTTSVGQQTLQMLQNMNLELLGDEEDTTPAVVNKNYDAIEATPQKQDATPELQLQSEEEDDVPPPLTKYQAPSNLPMSVADKIRSISFQTFDGVGPIEAHSEGVELLAAFSGKKYKNKTPTICMLQNLLKTKPILKLPSGSECVVSVYQVAAAIAKVYGVDENKPLAVFNKFADNPNRIGEDLRREMTELLRSVLANTDIKVAKPFYVRKRSQDGSIQGQPIGFFGWKLDYEKLKESFLPGYINSKIGFEEWKKFPIDEGYELILNEEVKTKARLYNTIDNAVFV